MTERTANHLKPINQASLSALVRVGYKKDKEKLALRAKGEQVDAILATGDPADITKFVLSLDPDKSRRYHPWFCKAPSMLFAVTTLLCWLRDRTLIEMEPQDFRDFLPLRALLLLANSVRDIPEEIHETLNTYLNTLPGYQANLGRKQSQHTINLHHRDADYILELVDILDQIWNSNKDSLEF